MVFTIMKLNGLWHLAMTGDVPGPFARFNDALKAAAELGYELHPDIHPRPGETRDTYVLRERRAAG